MENYDNDTINLSLQVVPVNHPNGYTVVDQAIKAIQASGVRHTVGPFATVMEGRWADLMAVVAQAKEAAHNAGAAEVLLNIQIHAKQGQDVRMADKTDKYG